MKIVIPDDLGLLPKHYKTIKSMGDAEIYLDLPSDKTFADRIKDADIITSGWTAITPAMMDSAKSLKYIIIEASGYQQWVDAAYAAKKGIAVLNCPTYSSAAVANMTIAFMLSLTRKIKAANETIMKGKWLKNPYRGMELEGRTLGLIGYGNIGRRVAEIAEKLGMKVEYCNSKTASRIDKILRVSDVVSLHLPLNGNTKHIMNSRRLGLMKKGAYLINVSRGGLVDQKALARALKSGSIAGAALDVFEDEPRRETSKGVSKDIIGLSRMGNVIATPHIAYNTTDMTERMGEEIIRNIESCIKGRPINVVNRP